MLKYALLLIPMAVLMGALAGLWQEESVQAMFLDMVVTDRAWSNHR